MDKKLPLDEREQRIDQALEQSFPASDPPCFVGAGAEPVPQAKMKARYSYPAYKTLE
jgi:hypothetical protein